MPPTSSGVVSSGAVLPVAVATLLGSRFRSPYSALLKVLGAAAVVKWIARLVARAFEGPRNLQQLMQEVPRNGKRMAIVGSGISGIQALKVALSEGFRS